jgi:ABC-type transporter Mla MlaB component
MSVRVSFVPKEDRLDLCFEGNLDFTVSHELCGIGAHIPASLRTCVMDLTRVQRVFDSGIALLRMLSGKLSRVGASVVVLSDHPDVRRQIPLILGPQPVVPARKPAAAAPDVNAV